MITRLKLKPGQNGTKKLLSEYGDALVCVRYRYDRASCTRAKTVELIVEKKAWTPSPWPQISDTTLVPVRIGFAETALQEKARAARGRWDPNAKVWFIQFGKIKGTVLEKHIVLDASRGDEKSKKHLIL
jgi:hypothetical protein